MIKSIDEKQGGIEIDLTGPDGNAFVLIGLASKWAKQLGLDSKKIQEEMMMLRELFGTFEGQLSLAVIVTIIGMAIFFTRLFLRKMSAGE